MMTGIYVSLGLDELIADSLQGFHTSMLAVLTMKQTPEDLANVIHNDVQGPLLLTWINFSPGMDE